MKRKFKKTENGNSEKFLSVSEKADLERSFMEDDRKQKLVDKEKNNDSSYDQKRTRKFLERMRKPGQSHFSRKRFFLVSYYASRSNKHWISSVAFEALWNFPNCAEIKSRIEAFENIDAYAIASIYEFRNEEDYLSYSNVRKGSPYRPLKDDEYGFSKEPENEN